MPAPKPVPDEDAIAIPSPPFSADFHDKKKLYTEVFILAKKERKVLLGVKKRGFKEGKLFGYGGKVDADDKGVFA